MRRRATAVALGALLALAGFSLVLLRPTRNGTSDPPSSVVLLHSHGRSGSTLAAALLLSTTSLFYLDEPLNQLYSTDSLIEDVLLSCRFPAVLPDDAGARQWYRWLHSRLSRSVAPPAWAARLPEGSAFRNPVGGIKPSIRAGAAAADLRSACLASPRVRAAKLIRLASRAPEGSEATTPMARALAAHPSVKVVHLVRHPYEVARSQEGLAWKGATASALAPMCASTLADAEAAAARGWGAAGRYTLVTYEELVRRPREAAARVHAFMGLTALEGAGRDALLEGGAAGSSLLVDEVFRLSASGASWAEARRGRAYSIVRPTPECGACGAEALEATAAVPACARLVERMALRCCGGGT